MVRSSDIKDLMKKGTITSLDNVHRLVDQAKASLTQKYSNPWLVKISDGTLRW